MSEKPNATIIYDAVDQMERYRLRLERERDEALEACCKLVIKAGLSTGHAETVEDLMREVLEQVDALRIMLKHANLPAP